MKVQTSLNLIGTKNKVSIIKQHSRLKYISLFLAIIMLTSSLFVIIPTVTSNPDDSWWNTSWIYRKAIIIDHSKVNEDISNFPFLIDITDHNLSSYAQSNGNDIVFTSVTAIKLSHEIESYNSVDGHLVAWVNIPSLSSTVNTTLYIYYGNPSATSQKNIEGTWNSDFKAVYHLKESWSTTAGHFKDSTTNHHNGTLTDANADSSTDIGIVGNGFRFNGDADFINIGVINFG